MKQIIQLSALILLLSTTGTVSAQNAQETSIQYNKTNQNGITASYDQSSDVIEAALKERLSKDGLGKPKSSKGFLVYSSTVWNAVSSNKLDVYFKVEGKKEKSTIEVLVSLGNENFISSGTDAQIIRNVEAFLNSFMKSANAYKLNLDIQAQNEAVGKAEKEYNKTISNNKDLASDREKLDKKILEGKNEEVMQQQALEAERQKLTGLKSKLN